MKYKILIYGIGEKYNKNLNIIKYYELRKEIEIVGVTARWMPKAEILDGYRIIQLDELVTVEYDYIVIMSDIYFGEIVEYLVGSGIDRAKLLTYRIFQIPNLNFPEYIELKNSNISIISNNCWGGVIYRTLGMECLSPFKNLSLEEKDYLKLLENFKYYMGCELQFKEYQYNRNSKKEYPVMLLDDIKVHCNHDVDPHVAKGKWDRRREKINYDNLLVEMYTEDKVTMEHFLKVAERYKKVVCFVPFKVDKENVCSISLYPGQKAFWEAVNSNAGIGANSNAYNCLDLILGRNAYRQK